MKIIIISHTPYMQTDNGIISKIVIDKLYNNFDISCIGFNHNIDIFSNKDGEYYYEDKCKIYPINENISNESVLEIFTIINAIKPDIVISIGDTFESEYIYAIKNLSSYSFKHINILLIDSFRNDFHDKNIKNINLSDKIIVTNLWAENYLNSKDINSEFLSVDTKDIFYKEVENKNAKILLKCLNDSYNNIIPILELLNEYFKGNVTCVLNEDRADYSVSSLKEKYKNVKFYNKYISIYDGLLDNDINDLYNNHDIFINLASKDSSAISAREAMKAGCLTVLIDNPSNAIDKSVDNIKYNFNGAICDSSQFITKNGEILHFPIIKDGYPNESESLHGILKRFTNKTFLDDYNKYKKDKSIKHIEKEQNLLSENIMRIIQETDNKTLNVFSP